MKRRIRIAAGLLLLTVLLSCSLFGCSGKSLRTVAFCGDYEVPYEELRYLTLSCRGLLAEREGTPDAKSPEYRATLEEMVIDALTEDYAIFALAKQYLPEHSIDDEDIQQSVDRAIEDAIDECGGKSEYKKVLKSVYLTDHLLRFHLACALLEEKTEDAIFRGSELENAEAFTEWLEAGNYVRVLRFTAPTEDALERVRELLAGGNTPEEAASAAGTSVTTGSYLVRGMAEDAVLEEDAFALEAPGAVSRIAAEETGFRLLLRLEDEPERMASQANDFRTRLREIRMEALTAEVRSSLTVTWTEYGEKLDLPTLK